MRARRPPGSGRAPSWTSCCSIALSLLLLLCYVASKSYPTAATASTAKAATKAPAAAQVATKAPAAAQVYTYSVAAEYPHDPSAFTQGFQYDTLCPRADVDCEEVFWESTGQWGQSSVRMVRVDTGEVLQATQQPQEVFGEGITRWGDRLYQISWLTNQAYIYSIPSLQQVGDFQTPLADGWGITVDDKGLMVLSDGSDTLTWIDPNDGFKRVRSVAVRDGGHKVAKLNELEYIEGEIWANIWMTECIARISPSTGHVTGWVLMHGLLDALRKRNLPQPYPMDVLNGIAWDAARRRLFVTGKYWPRIFDVKVAPLDNPITQDVKRRVGACLQGAV